MAEYVYLEYRSPEIFGKGILCDSPIKAIKALDELGMCRNWACLVQLTSDVAMMAYHAEVFVASNVRFFKLAFENDEEEFGQQLEILLRKIFRPFCPLEDPIYRASIRVDPVTDTKSSWFVDLILFFDTSVGEKELSTIRQYLDSIDDSHFSDPKACCYLL